MPGTKTTKPATQQAGFPGDPGYEEVPSTKYLDLCQSPEIEDPAEVSASIVKRVLGAGSFMDALQMGAQSARGLADIEGPFQLLDMSWHRAKEAYQNGLSKVFLVLTLAYPDGKTDVATCGGDNIVAQLYVAATQGWDKSTWMRVKSVQTSRGYDTLWLEPAETPENVQQSF